MARNLLYIAALVLGFGGYLIFGNGMEWYAIGIALTFLVFGSAMSGGDE